MARPCSCRSSKESLGTKGARITSFISLPGRYLVYMPQARHIGVSRRIRDERERDRLRAALRGLDPARPGGFIVRTNAEGKGEAEFAADVEFLGRLWAQIHAPVRDGAAPAALHEEGDLTFRVVRDLFSPEVDEFVVDDRAATTSAGLRAGAGAGLADRVRLYDERAPVFEAFGIEKDIEKALRRRVWLKSGGYIVIDHTEALVSIDVNTGKYVGKRDFEQTVLKINLEAVGEVVRQIRLRDLGGIIIIDFIDMERPSTASRSTGGQARAHRGQGPHQRAGDLRAGSGRDDAQARAPGPARAPDHRLPDLPGQRRREVRRDAGRRALRAVQAKARPRRRPARAARSWPACIRTSPPTSRRRTAATSWSGWRPPWR